MSLTLSTCFVQVQDPDLALTFYRDGLGLELRSGLAEVVEDPKDQPWGVRDGAVRDPSGNLVRIDQPPAA